MAMYTRTIIVLLIQLWIVAVLCRPTGKVDYATAKESANATDLPYAKYDTTEFAIFIRDGKSNEVWNSTYYPRVDEFSQLTIVESYHLLFNVSVVNENYTVWIEHPKSGFKLEPKRVYGYSNTSEDTLLLVPYFTVIMLLDKGNVTGMKWDDGCGNCRTDNCLDYSCANKRYNKDKTEDICSKKMNCNVKMYITWTGRDKNDAACSSYASAPSRFSQYSLTPVTNFGDGMWDDFFYKFSNNAPNPITGEYNQ